MHIILIIEIQIWGHRVISRFTGFRSQIRIFIQKYGNQIKSLRQKSPRKNLPEKIPLNAVERKLVETRVLNPNASEASYKPKQRSYRKTKVIYLFFFGGGFCRGDFIREPFLQ